MGRRVTEGPGDELRRQHEDLRRRTNWEDPANSLPDPDWESTDPPGAPLRDLRDLLGAVIWRPHSRPPQR
jgi:hypothetical protein